MDGLRSVTCEHNAALVFAFLQADTSDSELQKELLSLGKELNLVLDQNSCEGLETDGHLACSVGASLDDILPSVDLQLPREREGAPAIQQVAEGLREIAAHLEQRVVARSAQNLNRHILASPSDQWRCHLAAEVEKAMRHGVGLEHLPQERVIMALTLTIVRRVCEETPRLLGSLFATTLQYINPGRLR